MARKLTLLVLCLALVPACAGGPAPTAEASPPVVAAPEPLDAGLFERIAIVGASVSAGFNLQLETGVDARLADFLDEALLVPHELVSDGATELLFLNPEELGAEMVAAALEAEPTLVVAIDFPFWFLYGQGRTSADRLARLDAGLALLDTFACPVIVGDIPFMEDAAGGMIPTSSMPRADAFGPANQRIAAWVAAREDRTLVSLADFNRTLRAGEAFAVAGRTWRPEVDGHLLQADHLHPNMAGTAVLLVQTLSRLAAARDEVLAGVVMSDPDDLADAVDDRLLER